MENKVRTDFPIDWEEDGYVSRREFFKFMTLASGGLAAGSVGFAVWSRAQREERSFEPKRVGNLGSVGVGSAVLFNYPRDHDICILVRRSDGSLNAFSQRCTHLSCPVRFEAEHDRLYCPCHSGAFSAADGRVLQGPPPRPLPQIMLEVRGDEIWAVGARRSEVTS